MVQVVGIAVVAFIGWTVGIACAYRHAYVVMRREINKSYDVLAETIRRVERELPPRERAIFLDAMERELRSSARRRTTS